VFCGIDVGLKKSYAAVIAEGVRVRVEFVGECEELELDKVRFAGIDAPLSFPLRGNFRECERLMMKMGIRLFPSGAQFFRKIALRGMEIAERLKENGIEVYEVYPYATRVMLNIAPRAKKRRREGLEEIRASLAKWIGACELSHDEVDAVIAALTVKLYCEGKGLKLEGVDGSIIVPKPEIAQVLNLQ